MGRARHRKAEHVQPAVASAPAAPPPPWLAWLPWILIALFYVVVRVQIAGVPLDRDEGGLGSIGQRILDGNVPYRDFFDHKPPGLYYLVALGVALTPPTASGFHAFLHVWNVLAVIGLAYVAWKLAGRAAALWTAFIYSLVSAAPSVQGFTTSAELLAIAPIAGSFAVALGAGERRRDLLMHLSGVLAAFAFLIKPPYALPLLATPLLFRAIAPARWKRDTVAWVAGGAVVGAVVAVAFWSIGIWSEFWYWNSTHNVVYRERSWDGWTARLSNAISILTPDLIVPLVLAAAGCVWAFMKKQRYALFLTLFLVLSVWSCIQAGYVYMHYFAQITAALALAAGIGAPVLVGAVAGSPGGRRAAAIALAAIVLAVPVFSKPWYWVTPDPIEVTGRMLGQGFEVSQIVADHLREQTQPGDAVWMFGNESQIPYLADRRNANPFFVMYPMWSALPRSREFQERTWAEVQKTKPEYIFISRARPLMTKVEGSDPFIEQRLNEALPAYRRESCLSIMPEGPVLHTQLDKKGIDCPGQRVFELWRRN